MKFYMSPIPLDKTVSSHILKLFLNIYYPDNIIILTLMCISNSFSGLLDLFVLRLFFSKLKQHWSCKENKLLNCRGSHFISQFYRISTDTQDQSSDRGEGHDLSVTNGNLSERSVSPARPAGNKGRPASADVYKRYYQLLLLKETNLIMIDWLTWGLNHVVINIAVISSCLLQDRKLLS